MSPASMYRGLRCMRNVDACGSPDPAAFEYHKAVYDGVLIWNRAISQCLRNGHSGTGGQS
jgi:hypothetical protein